MDRQYGSITRYDEEDFRILRTDDDGNLCFVPSSAGLPYQFFLTTNGLQSGTKEAIANYSSNTTDFYYTSAGRYELYSLIVNISDNANFNQGDFGAITGGLTNGIKFFADLGGGVEVPLFKTDVWPIKKNYQWLSVASDSHLTTFAGTSQTFSLDFNVVRDYGRTFPLDAGQKFIARVSDDLSTLVSLTFIIRGTLFT